MKYVLIFLVKIYQTLISPLFPASCRHYPTCSNYAIDAFKEWGSFKGSYLAGKRILKCNPFFKGGFDPVPHNSLKKTNN
ncbi:MAG: membrane protein insertion efficiency factor YidD [Ignavibacteriaceae bacterium]|nr:MAG: membrane protein insertion efficiency factor YidD [Chlorobiota bacterium]MCC6885086.1 membrane protein insertion efficiency factor YidD [Ignavibacteriales bacterium]MCE7952124.1 membrane protein insertion efficiency factor YidD [Chlorobi bacterium CHB7]MDL1886319.1 membrane protein insertion efficiency factor YidD [Ignavibacteria bacterium CHB1]MEB2329409.1 membrane protein insertion efficiency factor YidD [Ignavibacteriaceae bacterium]RIK49473.1 MAG: membrane protein insertion efficie